MIIDLSHPIIDGMPAYPGLPPAEVGMVRTHEQSRELYDGQAEFAISRFVLVGNVGTYLDSPYHRFCQAPDIADLRLEDLVDLDAIVVDVEPLAGRAIDITASPDLLAGRAVLIRTGWDRHWGTPAYWNPGPYLSDTAIQRLVDAEVALVGVDCSNIDDPHDPRRPAHTTLLGCEIPVVEHLRRLDALPGDGFRFSALPLPIVGAASCPIRAYATIPAGPPHIERNTP